MEYSGILNTILILGVISLFIFCVLIVLLMLLKKDVSRINTRLETRGRGSKDMNNTSPSQAILVVEEQFDSIFGNIGDGIIVLNSDNEVRYLNRSAENLLDKNADQVTGKVLQDILIVTNDEMGCKPILDIIEGFKDNGSKQVSGYRCTLETESDLNHDVDISIVPLRDLGSNLIGSALIIHEVISEEKVQKDPVQVLQQHLKSLDQIKKLFGENHSTTANYYNNTAYLYFLQKKYNKAISLYKKAAEIRQNLYGEDHPSVATTYDDLGRVYHAMGDYAQALDYLNKSLAIKKDKLGIVHGDTAYTYHTLGRVHHTDSDYEKALEYYKEALRIRETINGHDHLDTASTYNNIGGLYLSQDQHDKALEYFHKALDIREKLLGDRHVKIAQVCLSLGILYYEKTEPEKSEEYLLKAADIFLDLYGPQHPETRNTYHWIAHLYDALGRKKEAGTYRDKTEFFKGNLI